jgi:hypothetical protein
LGSVDGKEVAQQLISELDNGLAFGVCGTFNRQVALGVESLGTIIQIGRSDPHDAIIKHPDLGMQKNWRATRGLG